LRKRTYRPNQDQSRCHVQKDQWTHPLRRPLLSQQKRHMHDPAANNLQWHTKRSDCDRSSWLMRNPQRPRLLSSAFMPKQGFQMINTSVKSFCISALAVLRVIGANPGHPGAAEARQRNGGRRTPLFFGAQRWNYPARIRVRPGFCPYYFCADMRQQRMRLIHCGRSRAGGGHGERLQARASTPHITCARRAARSGVRM
jgi:hypothetical protein